MSPARPDPSQGCDPGAVGLPQGVSACLFDLDGVLTDTAEVHFAAWKETFDVFLREDSGQRPFTESDYVEHVDGRPRDDGVRAFLESRGLAVEAALVAEVGERKQQAFERRLHADGVRPFPGSERFVRAAREAGLATAVVTSSTNRVEVLAAAGLDELFDGAVDGNVARDRGLSGKPAPDYFLAGAGLLGVEPSAAAVFEDALSGVEAGRAGSFGTVVGVATRSDPAALREHGADVVVRDLAELIR